MNTAVVFPPIAFGHALDVALALHRGMATVTDLSWAVATFGALTLAVEIPRLVKRWWLMTAQQRIGANIRADAIRGVLGWPMERLAVTPVGDVMARVVSDVQILTVAAGELIVETWDTVLFSLALAVAMFVLDFRLAALTLLPIPVAVVLASLAGRWVSARTAAARAAAARLSTALHELISDVRVLKLFGRMDAAESQIRSAATTQGDAELGRIRLDAALTAIYLAAMSAGVLVIVAVGGNQVVAGPMTLGTLVVCLQLFTRFIVRAPRIPLVTNRVQSGSAASRRLDPLLAPPPSRSSEPRFASFRAAHIAGSGRRPSPPPVPQAGAAEVRIDRLTFRYPEAPAPTLEDVTLRIPAGSLVGVAGPVGSGKTTLSRVLAGLWQPADGTVLIDGRPVGDLEPGLRASRIGYMAQHPHLFSGTVAESVLLGSRVPFATRSEARLREAARIASLDRDLAAMADGFDTHIGELGVGVSGGQRQRIGLARAVFGTGSMPGLLILDDPFAAIDVQTEAAIIEALRHAFGPGAPAERRATIVLCSQRVAVFPRADLVVVLAGGRIEEVGTHIDLLARGGLYARIFLAQSRLSGSPNLIPTHERPR